MFGGGTLKHRDNPRPLNEQNRFRDTVLILRCHDFYLHKYEVSDKEKTITFHLVYDYPNTEKIESCIKFNDVALYHFEHTDGSIITDIGELPIPKLITEISVDLKEWQHWYSVRFFNGSIPDYVSYLQTEGYRAWRIDSAIGFYGFVIAKQVSNAR